MSLDFEHLTTLKATLDSGLKTFLPLLQDKSIPLADRWAAYCKLVNTGVLHKVQDFGDGFITELGLDNPYDAFYFERYTTSGFIELLDYDATKDASLDMIERWKEAVLASGYSHFTWDW